MAFDFVKTALGGLTGLGLGVVIAAAVAKWEVRHQSAKGFPLSRNYTAGAEGKR